MALAHLRVAAGRVFFFFPINRVAMLMVRRATVAVLLIAFLQLDAAQKRQQIIVKYHSAVATDDGRYSDIGMSVLRQGGNAVDASVAAALCLGAVSPASSGIDSGAFMVVKIADGKDIAYDSRETAPLLATEVFNILSQYRIPSGVSASLVVID